MWNRQAEERVRSAEDVFSRSRRVVVPNASMEHWLKEHRMFAPRARDGQMQILADVEFPLLHPFVNEALYRMRHKSGPRDPASHPFSAGAMQWRLYAILMDPSILNGDVFAPLKQFMDVPERGGRGRRAFRLAGDLARLFDDGQVYRPDLLAGWEKGRDGELDPSRLWKPGLWRLLVEGRARETYLSDFLDMESELKHAGLQDQFSEVNVFGISILPQAYLYFFRRLGDLMPVHLYLLNPCREDWDQVRTRRDVERERLKNPLVGGEDMDRLLDVGNPLLAGMGRGCRNLLASVLDLTQGQVDDEWQEGEDRTLLGNLQADILNNRVPESAAADPDLLEPLEVQICHSPRRELEVLQDYLLRWLGEKGENRLQPREVQVLVTDMKTYGPLIDAVFGRLEKNAKDAIPYRVADRLSAGESRAVECLDRLLQLPDSRFTAAEVMDLLRYGSVHRAFGFTEEDLEPVTDLVRNAGICWGLDGEQRASLNRKIAYEEETTWQYGLDRLLLGYVLSREMPGSDELPVSCDRVEDEGAALLGRLGIYVLELKRIQSEAQKDRTVDQWADWVTRLIDRFFRPTNDSYQEIAALHRAAGALKQSAEAAGFTDAVPLDVIRDNILSLMRTPGADSASGGSGVLFCALRSGAPAPRRVICLLGLGDGLFPRPDSRKAYDLLLSSTRFGDPSVRTEDRAAFLEAVLAARERLYLSFTGRDVTHGEKIPPATVLAELCEAARMTGGEGAVKEFEHRLHPFDPAYFHAENDSDLFSYHRPNWKAAQALMKQEDGDRKAGEVPRQESSPVIDRVIDLDDLLSFFRNPSRYYYQKILKADLEGVKADTLAQHEAFDVGGIDKWSVDQSVIEGLKGALDSEAVRREKLADGLLPLGSFGKAWFEERWGEVEGYLDAEVEDRRLIEWLRNQQLLGNKVLHLDTGYEIRGGLYGAEREAGDPPLALDFRAGSEKQREVLGSWIRHLFACACGAHEVRYCIQGRRINPRPLPEVSMADANAHLLDLVDLYIQGRQKPLPFTCEASAALVKKGSEAASKKWFSTSSRSNYDGDRDAYYLAAFGEEGPMSAPEFEDVAKRVFEPLWPSPGEA